MHAWPAESQAHFRQPPTLNPAPIDQQQSQDFMKKPEICICGGTIFMPILIPFDLQDIAKSTISLAFHPDHRLQKTRGVCWQVKL